MVLVQLIALPAFSAFHPIVGPEISWRNETRSAIGLGAHYTWEMDRKTDSSGIQKASLFTISAQAFYTFGEKPAAGERIGLDYVPWSMEKSRKFWKVVPGLFLQHQFTREAKAIYLIPYLGISDSDVLFIGIGYKVPLMEEKQFPSVLPFEIEFKLRPFNLKYMTYKFSN